MKIEVNGEIRDVAEGSSLGELISMLALPPERVAVELNREVVPRAAWAERRLGTDDKIEIVHFVGGGNIASESMARGSESSRAAAEARKGRGAHTCQQLF